MNEAIEEYFYCPYFTYDNDYVDEDEEYDNGYWYYCPITEYDYHIKH